MRSTVDCLVAAYEHDLDRFVLERLRAFDEEKKRISRAYRWPLFSAGLRCFVNKVLSHIPLGCLLISQESVQRITQEMLSLRDTMERQLLAVAKSKEEFDEDYTRRKDRLEVLRGQERTFANN